jgi:hypothetical protein
MVFTVVVYVSETLDPIICRKCSIFQVFSFGHGQKCDLSSNFDRGYYLPVEAEKRVKNGFYIAFLEQLIFNFQIFDGLGSLQ